MAPKRTRDEADLEKSSSSPYPKKKKGFSVGPANLPDGTYRRKVQKIKGDLIHKAKLKKSYAKIKAQELANQPTKSIYDTEDHDNNDNNDKTEDPEPATLDLHPARQAMLDAPPPEPESTRPERKNNAPPNRRERPKRKPKPSPFAKEMELVEKRRQEAAAKRKAREVREKDREAMARAKRPDQFGKRRLGRESKVLLDRVQRIVGGT
ncbi:hypothetical protein FQN54_009008 [Arachnomyces sp. PD_36]|nr:hypothetical protein FQN54_009008 [Arachnomyces sp. PD_36]